MNFEQVPTQSGTINWAHISLSAFANERTPNQCKNRWNKTLKLRYSDIRVGPWSSVEVSGIFYSKSITRVKVRICFPVLYFLCVYVCMCIRVYVYTCVCVYVGPVFDRSGNTTTGPIQ